jgi:hypothetical protein
MTWAQLNTFQSSSETFGIALFIVYRQSWISILRLSFDLFSPKFVQAGVLAGYDGTACRRRQHLGTHYVERIVELVKV